MLDLVVQYEIERETVSTVLEAALRERGSEKQLARTAGITPIHLSYIRAGKRMPSVDTAAWIAAVLPWTAEERAGFVHHVAQVWRLKDSLRRTTRYTAPGRPSQLVVDLARQTHHDATCARDSGTAQQLYRRARTMAELLLDVTDPCQDPLNFCELSFVAHDALCVLNRSDEALWHAKRVRAIAAQLERNNFRNKERIDFVQVNALRCEAVALHNLGLAREMQRVCDKVEALDGLKRAEHFWRPWLNRDKIQALEGTARFSIRQAEYYAREVYRLLERLAADSAPLLNLLISESLARAYLRHANFDKAYRVLTQELARLERIPQIGMLHRVLLLRTMAEWYWRQGSRGEEWRYFAKAALELAAQAGLDHQWNEMQSEFGDAFLEKE